MPRVALDSRAAARWRRGHPWVYADGVLSVEEAAPGDVVLVHDAAGQALGQAFFNPRSRISLRRISFEQQSIDRDFWSCRLRAALERRAALRTPQAGFRWVHADADGLPGLIVDVYDRSVVIQTLVLGADLLTHLWIELIEEILQPERIVLRNDPTVRALEGLPSDRTLVLGEGTSTEIREAELCFTVDLWEGQKTGLFLDQRDNRMRMGELAQGRCLDVFTHQGGFAMHLAKQAKSVLAADTSEPALARGREDALRNGLQSKIAFECENAFDLLGNLDRQGERFDVIVLDPPAFARSRKDLASARRGYGEINRRALRLLSEGGVLLTCSCSYNLPKEEFVEVVKRAAGEARRSVRLLEDRGQPLDHPVLLELPESRYLKGLLVQAADPPASRSRSRNSPADR
ncbi:MAG: class I SAM-dependent rRNA methyltransferase [Acidobacteriota bacterium]|nr:class I SAM-dependent rRNA methyltransferase [Acidobacteriota bacterium]